MVTLRKQMRAFCLMCQRYLNSINTAVKEQVGLRWFGPDLSTRLLLSTTANFVWSVLSKMLKCRVHSRPSPYYVICYWSSVTKLCLQAGNNWSLWSTRQTPHCRPSCSTSFWIKCSLIRMMTAVQVRANHHLSMCQVCCWHFSFVIFALFCIFQTDSKMMKPVKSRLCTSGEIF